MLSLSLCGLASVLVHLLISNGLACDACYVQLKAKTVVATSLIKSWSFLYCEGFGVHRQAGQQPLHHVVTKSQHLEDGKALLQEFSLLQIWILTCNLCLQLRCCVLNMTA